MDGWTAGVAMRHTYAAAADRHRNYDRCDLSLSLSLSLSHEYCSSERSTKKNKTTKSRGNLGRGRIAEAALFITYVTLHCAATFPHKFAICDIGYTKKNLKIQTGFPSLSSSLPPLLYLPHRLFPHLPLPFSPLVSFSHSLTFNDAHIDFNATQFV